MDPNNSIITEIRVTMARLEEKIDNISDAKTTADEVNNLRTQHWQAPNQHIDD